MEDFMRFLLILMGVIFMSGAYAKDFTITSEAFTDGSKIPVLYTCSGKDISPPLAWSNAPEKTQSFVLVFSDPDAPAGTWYHWVIYNIPSSTQELAENIKQLPAGSVLGKNSWDKERYNGPCPPPGKPHHYIFTLYALDTKLNTPDGIDALTLQKLMKTHVLQHVQLIGLFGR